MNEIQITEDMKITASEWESVVLSKLPPNGTNYTGLSREHRFYYGYLGELCLFYFLRNAGKKCVYHVNLDGHNGKDDFVLSFSFGDRSADVKTATKPTHSRIMFPQSQLYVYDYYVGVRLAENSGEICGFCRHDNFRGPDDFGYNVPTMWLGLTELSPIKTILSKLENGDSVLSVVGN